MLAILETCRLTGTTKMPKLVIQLLTHFQRQQQERAHKQAQWAYERMQWVRNPKPKQSIPLEEKTKT